MEPTVEDIRLRYRLCSLAFGLIALSLGLLCAAKVSLLALLFGARHEVRAIHDHPGWFWLVDMPITWAALLGSYLLWGRWPVPHWQRRAGLLLIMNGLDAVMWTIDHARRFGFAEVQPDLVWTFFVAANSLGWFELMLAAALASDLAAHLGREDAHAASAAASTVGVIGAIVWGLLALSQTDWGAWPLAPRFTPEFHVLLLVTTILMVFLTFQVTIGALTAARLSAAYDRELRDRESNDDLLQSRSETEGDDIFWND